MEKSNLAIIINLHELYLAGNAYGRQANLAWEDLSGANLSGENLIQANLTRVNLSGANLTIRT